MRIAIELLSDATFSTGETTAGEVDVEIDHDELGLPIIGGKALHGLLHEAWRSMSPLFPELASAGRRVFGLPADFDETARLRISDARLDPLVVQSVDAAVHREIQPVTPAEILFSLTDIRHQTAEERESGAPATTTLRKSRVTRRGLSLFADVRWLSEPDAGDLQCLALALLVTRAGGVSRNRGRGHIRMTLDESDAHASAAERLDATKELIASIDEKGAA